MSSGRSAEYMTEAARKYGVTFRSGPNEIHTADPDAIRRTGSSRSRYTRSTWYSINRLDPKEDSMFSLMDTAEHDRLKAKVTLAYSGREV